MSYDEPESGKTVIVKYDQSTDEDEEWVCNIRGEVMSRLDDCVDVNDESRGRTLRVDLGNDTVTIIRERTPEGQPDDVPEYDLVDFEMETVSNHLINSDDLYDNSEKYTEDLDDVTMAIARANAAIGMVHAESDASWVYASDALNAADVYENGIEQRIDDHNEVAYGQEHNRATIVFPSNALALMWIEEICGQISDGAWENEVRDWEQYYSAEVVVDESNRNVEVEGDLPPLDFSEKLREYEGLMGRMMFYVLASGVENEYSRGAVDEAMCMRLQNGFVDSQ